jgi:FkbM family methyltransferase
MNELMLYLSERALGYDNWRDHVISGEEAFLRALLSKASKRPVVLDVGAYHGEYAKIARSYSPTAVIYCFEPHPRSFITLQKAAQEHALTELRVAVGAQSGDGELFDFADDDGSKMASLYEETLRARRNVPLTTHKTEVVTVDDFVSTRGIEEVELLKIDAEGAELEILKGAHKSIRERRIKAIQFEIGDATAIRENWMRDYYDLLTGYSFYRLLPRGLLPLGQYRPMREVFRFQNLAALLET